MACALLASLDLIERGEARRTHLQALIARLRDGLAGTPWRLIPSPTAIQPIIIGDNHAALRVAAALYERGIWAPAIRPPTVPLRDDKHQPLPVDFWRNIAEHIAAPEAVLLMKNETPPVLLYIYDLGGDKGKVALKMDYDLEVRTQGGKRKIKGNILRTGSMLYTEKEIESLQGHIEIWKK